MEKITKQAPADDAGRPLWREMYRRGAFDAITVGAMPLVGDDAAATRWFLRVYTSKENLFYLQPATLVLLEQDAEAGNAYALFALGRCHITRQLAADSTDRAVDCFERAWAKGLAEGAVALSMAYEYGDTGMVDRPKAQTLLGEALKLGCEWAAELQLRKLAFGLAGTEADPKRAMQICDELIAHDKASYGDSEEVNPKWLYYKGCVRQSVEGYSHGGNELRAAAEGGTIAAWLDYVIAASHDDEGRLTDKAAYAAALREGAAHRSAACAYFLAMTGVEDYEQMSDYRKPLAAKQLIVDLQRAMDNGSNEAAAELGDIYYYGSYGIAEDNELAFKHYANGGLRYDVNCMERMHSMIHDHYIDRSESFSDMLALRAVRNGSQKLIGEVVMAYTYGRLTEYAAEIEQLYVPLFDGETKEDENGDDDTPDDDGRFDAYV